MIFGILKDFKLDSKQFNELENGYIVTLPYEVSDTMKGDFVDFVEVKDGKETNNIKTVEIISSVCVEINQTRFRVNVCEQDSVKTVEEIYCTNGVA